MSDDLLTTQARLADLRVRVMNREPVEPHEYHDLLLDLRRHRNGAAAASSKARTAAKKASTAAPALDLDAMFSTTYGSDDNA